MRTVSLTEFAALPSQKEGIAKDIELDALPEIEAVVAEADWTDDMLDLFEKPKEEVEDRSSALQRFAYSAAEVGWTDEQIMAALYALDDRWQKYTARRKATRDNIILNLVNRAREKVGYTSVDIEVSKFLRDPEVPTVDATEPAKTQLVWGADEFVKADFPINWMLDGLLPEEGIGFISGFPGSGKTQFALQLASYLALGYEKFVKWPITNGERKVLFLSLEMGPAPFHHFMETIGRTYAEHRKSWNKNLRVAPIGEPIPLDTKAGQKFLDNLLEAEQPDVLIIDSLQTAMSKEMTDETASKALMQYVMRTRTKYGCAVIIIHHNRKKSAEAKRKDMTELSDMYGSIMFSANADFVLGIDKQTDGGLVSVHSLKIRLGPTPPPIDLLRDENLHFDVEFSGLYDKLTGGGEDDDGDEEQADPDD